MASSLPLQVVLQSKYNNKYLEYVKEKGQVQGYVRFSGEDVTSSLSKFDVELAKSDSNLVHLRSCYNNKYLVAASETVSWIVPEADKSEEDQSRWSCTLFEPVPFTEGRNDFRFRHVRSGNYAVLMRMGVEHAFTNCVNARWSSPNSDLCDVCTVIDWNSLVILPRYITFRGDNGSYLRANGGNLNYLQFIADDIADETVGHEVFPNPDGTICLKSTHLGKYWRLNNSPPNNWILADSDDTSSNDKATVFWPVKYNDNTINLRSLGNDLFCKRYTSGVMSGLSAIISTIDVHARLQVVELVTSRDIHNVEFHLDRARRYNEQVVVTGSGDAVNTDSQTKSLEVKVSSIESRSRSWDDSVSLKLGIKTTLSSKVPFLTEEDIKLSDEISTIVKIGETQTETNPSGTVVYTVILPPMAKVTISTLETTATCDVPFSYTRTDTYVDGRKETYQLDDGTFTGTNGYRKSVEIKVENI